MNHHTNNLGDLHVWRDPQRIGNLAVMEAQRHEENCERAGQLYMLSEILTALHRQAEALEKHNSFAEPYYKALKLLTKSK